MDPNYDPRQGLGCYVKTEFSRHDGGGWEFEATLLASDDPEADSPYHKIGASRGVIASPEEILSACDAISGGYAEAACLGLKDDEDDEDSDGLWRLCVMDLVIDPKYRGHKLSWYLAKEVLCLFSDFLPGGMSKGYFVAWPDEKVSKAKLKRLEKHWEDFGLTPTKRRVHGPDGLNMRLFVHYFGFEFPAGSWMHANRYGW